MGEHLPLPRSGLFRVHGHDDALRAEVIGGLLHEFRARHRGGVDRDLVGAGIEHAAHVLDLANAAADRERDEYLLGDLLNHVHDSRAVVAAGGDVEESDFVGALLVVAARDLDWIAGVADLDELDALDHTAVVHVEAGNDAFGKAHIILMDRINRIYRIKSKNILVFSNPVYFFFPNLSASFWAAAKSSVPS